MVCSAPEELFSLPHPSVCLVLAKIRPMQGLLTSAHHSSKLTSQQSPGLLSTPTPAPQPSPPTQPISQTPLQDSASI